MFYFPLWKVYISFKMLNLKLHCESKRTWICPQDAFGDSSSKNNKVHPCPLQKRSMH